MKRANRQEVVRELAHKYTWPQEVQGARGHLIEFGLVVWNTARRQARREANRRRWYLRPTHLKNIRRAGH